MILTGEGITTAKIHYRHLDKSTIDAQVSISHKQRFLGLLPKSLNHSLLHIIIWYECVALKGVFLIGTFCCERDTQV
jgi:uncharacterized protein Usg